MRFSHLSSLPRVRKNITRAIARANARETSNNNAVKLISSGGIGSDIGFSKVSSEDLRDVGAYAEETLSPAEVTAFWKLVDSRIRSYSAEFDRQQQQQQQRQQKQQVQQQERQQLRQPRKLLGEELTTTKERHRARDTSTSSRNSPTRSPIESQELLKRFEGMTSSHKLAIQWRETKEFIGEEEGKIVLAGGRDAKGKGA